MFGGNSTPFTMPVTPAYGMGGGGFGGGWGNDWIALAILALIFGDGWGMGGMGGMGMFLPFMFMNGWGGFSGNSGGSASAQGALTREQACIDNNFQNLMRETAGISDAVNVGFANLNSTICNQQYDTARMFNSLEGNILGGLNAMNITNLQNANAANVVALQNQNALQTQLAECCCENRSGQMQLSNQIERQTCSLQNTMNTNTRDIIDNQNAGTRAILDYLCQEKISDLQNENNALRLQASQQAQTNQIVSELLPVAKPAYLTCSPYASAFGYPYGGYGYNNNGCGCGCGCGVA